MGVYKLSNESKIDVSKIYEFGIEKFGLNQAQEYLTGLHDLFQTLANNSNIGRDASELHPLLKRFTYKSHIVFYLQSKYGIFVVRTLHQSMDYERYF
ncbi:MAG: type II toxin-antitoxin system RelE/ParE family toxin [Fulvivirga sp.]|jgi:toxin ParE1/3/4